MASYTLIANAIKVHNLIFNRRAGDQLTKPDIARKLEISEKQVSSALEFLKGMGYPAAYNEQNHYWFYDWTPADRHRIIADELLPRLRSFPKADFAILLMLNHGLQALRNTRLYNDAKQFVDLLNDDRLSVMNAQVRKIFSYKSRAPEFLDTDCFEAVASAIYQRKQISFHYQKPGDLEFMLRTVDPHHLTCNDEMWYLLGWIQYETPCALLP
jgi:predicted DNA-binding transcriptional regulator YafY